ncbi:neuron navigator 3 isoform X3 [Anguilla rostrata]|uniref:neuron navigator 3 isoform X3 n=1 Tax=Anguilla rostrata TaxID=7938 RepID=UPI0030D2D63C
MPVLGLSSKLRQPAAASGTFHHPGVPVPVPSLRGHRPGTAASRGAGPPPPPAPAQSCQLSLKSPCGHQERVTPLGRDEESEECKVSKIYTDWANHYLAKSGCPRLIKDLTQDIADGVLLAEIIQIIANEKVEDINGCPRSQSQMIENVDACLSFLEARGVNVQGLSSEEIWNGNLKTILGLFFNLSRYKQQQQQQQQYYQSLLELQQQVTHQATGAATASHHKTQDMQSSLTARYATATATGHSGAGLAQKKNTRLPGPSRASAAGGGPSKAPGAANLNRRSQSFTSMDKSRPLQYASGNDRELVKGISQPGSLNGSSPPPGTPGGHQPPSAIPSPGTGKSLRGKPVSMKHSATSSSLSVRSSSPPSSPPPPPQPAPGPAPGPAPCPASDRLKPPQAEAPKAGGSGQRSMLEKFRFINTRGNARPPPAGSGVELREEEEDEAEEEDALSEYGEEGLLMGQSGARQTAVGGGGGGSAPKGSAKGVANKPLPQSKDKEDKGKSKGKSGTPAREDRDPPSEPAKKTSRIASLIPKGGKTPAVKKEGVPSACSGIPKPGAKPSASSSAPGGKMAAAAAPAGSGSPAPGDHKAKPSKGSQAACSPRHQGAPEGRRTSMVSSTSASAISGSAAMAGGVLGANGVVQLPLQQHSHPNTATVAPFMYRTCSENDCTTVAPGNACLSPTKADLVYGKTAKQCLEEISGEDPEARRMRTVRNIADLRQNLEETMSSLRGTQVSHSTLETTFDSTVTTEVNGRGLPALGSRSWRLGQSPSPRLQAGDAPSLPGGYPQPRAGGGAGGGGGSGGGGGTGAARYADPSRLVYNAPLRRGAAGVGPRGAELGEKGGAEGGPEAEVGGYMSDGDILGKNARPDDISSGYLTDGGLNLYSRNVGRAPELAASRDVIQRGVNEMQGGTDSWDDSSSVSSGLSDTLDNISTDDLNTPYYSSTSAPPRKSKHSQPKSDAEPRGSPDHDISSWDGAEDLKKSDDGLDGAMWKPSSSSSSSAGQYEDPDRTGQRAGMPLSHTGSWRRGMTAQVGITPPRTKGAVGALKNPGKADDSKVSEKDRGAPPKSSGIQRSPSDAGRSSGDEGKKPPSGIGRPAAAIASFGFKKVGGPVGALITKAPAGGKGGPAGGGGGGGGGRKTSLDLDGSQPQDDGALLGGGASRAPPQYRSLPRPAKSSPGGALGRGGSGGGGGGGGGHRSSSSSVDSNVSGKSAGSAGGGANAKRRDGGKVGSGRSSPVAVCQADKEKAGAADPEGACLSSSPKASPTSSGQSGLRQPGSKYPDIASPTFRRLFGTKASSKASSPGTPDSGKCPSALSSPHGTLARQSSLDSPSSGTGSLGSGQGGGTSPLYGRAPELGAGDAPPGLGQSPGSSSASGLSHASGGRPWAVSMSVSSAGSKDTLSCQSMTSLHTSSESIDLAAGYHGSLTGLASGSKVTRTGSVKSTLSEGMPLDRNTLPKKGLRYPPSSRQMSDEEGKEWMRSHSTGGLQDTGSQSPLSPPGTSCTANGKYHYSNLVSPTSMPQFGRPGPSMSRSNSIPAQDSALDLYGEARGLGGSATSLEDRPRGMSRSGSLRDSMEEVHGSSLSLVSSTSSLYSAAEEKAHSEQIRKLRRELDASQEKVATLTSQLAANCWQAHLVAAFEKSLGNMTSRLQSLTMTAEQKESELAELRETIEALKAQNTDAQTAIQVALNGPDHLHRDLRLRRQHSSDSMSSLTSASSHCAGGGGLDAEAKKKKKKSWLRSSFKQAFSKKKPSKPSSSHSDIEEQTDSSQPSSPKLPHGATQGGDRPLRPSPSTTDLCECTEAEAEIILQLKNELREKELKLTDIRLEALSSAHHLDQIREAMNRMQNEIELLKAENDQLKSTGSPAPGASPAKTARPPSETSSTSSSSSRQSLGLSLNNLNITDTIMSDILLDDGSEGNLRKEGRSVRIVVAIDDGSNVTKGMRCQDFLIGSIGVSGKTKWDVLDGVIRRLFKEYVFRVDPLTSLGLSSDSIASYRIGEVLRAHGSETPQLLPCGYLVGDNNIITVNIKGASENSIDSLAFDTLIPKPVVQRYLNLLTEHRRIILSGPSGTGKSYLAGKLAQHIAAKAGREVTEATVASFSVDHESSKDLQQYLSSLVEQYSSEESDTKLPLVVVLDNLHHIGSLSDVFNGFLNCKYNKCPYVIGTMNQAASSSANLELHHNFRWVLCANHTEPVKGFLGRFLRRKLVETEILRNTRSNDLVKVVDWIPKTWQHLNSFLEAHSSSDVTIGPRLFLSCPMDSDRSRAWFTDLWNYSLVPYLLEAVREGLQLYGKRTVWEDPSKWVIDTYPWSSAPSQPDAQPLLQLRPEDVGYDGCSGAKEETPSKQMSQSDTEGDPLMSMLMRLQEAANYSSAQSCDSDSASHHDDPLDSSLESTL